MVRSRAHAPVAASPNEDDHLVASGVGLERDCLPIVRDPDVPGGINGEPSAADQPVEGIAGPVRRDRGARMRAVRPLDATELREPASAAKLATQTLSLPSTAMPQGMVNASTRELFRFAVMR